MSARPAGVVPATRATVLLAVLALLAVVLGGVRLAQAGAGSSARQVTVDGVPLTEVRAGSSPGRHPGVVVAHGFAGSARLMRPLADTVARHGAVALLLDFAGHGANPARLPGAGRDGSAARAVLEHDLDVAVAHLRALPDVDPDRIVLVGHSMGAGAVTRYAATHPEIAATVAVSLPDAGALPYGRPRALRLVVGGAEFPGFRRAAEQALRAAPPGQRSLTVVSGTEHISVLFAGRTHETVVAALPGGSAGPPPRPGARLAGAGLLLLGLGVGFVPLVAALRGRRPDGPAAADVRPVTGRWLLLGAVAVAAGLAAVVATVAPTVRLPLAVGGYVTGYLLLTGLLLAVLARRLVPGRGTPPVREAGSRPAPLAALTIGYALVSVAVPIHLGFTAAWPVGARWWLLPVVAVGCLAFLLGAERIAAGRSGRYAAVLALTVLVLAVAAVAGLAPGFVLLVVPLFAVLAGWAAAWAAVLRRAGVPGWLPAVVGTVLLAWPIATTLPLA
ncbi:alpha/beta fold hydrolase [Micromonospora siamensis]|uniref:Alpha/beta hydrolase family protein n=1 Tax=Micromonospora siamensis TaxID=299152 RepID=A0A1C5HK80_9ACTN|nr:alpha/beta fold hydrolase [Micromonospora siamensis]SCG46436.1 Alpha/beta hydrolase family protein [Micromonospora siamensis]